MSKSIHTTERCGVKRPSIPLSHYSIQKDIDASADDIVILCSNYRETPQSSCALVVMSARIPIEQYQAVLLGGSPLENVDKFEYLGPMCVENGQGTEEIKCRINLACSAVSLLQSHLWSGSEISSCTMNRVYRAVVRQILQYGCEIWAVRVPDESMLAVVVIGSNVRILRVRHRGCGVY